jgi:polyisoprenoid-binding protein YceI
MSTTEINGAPAGTWSVDKVHSHVGFAVDYMAGTFTGSFADFDASLADGVLKGSARVASVQVKDPNLEAHLQSPDFFDGERQPELSFESTTLERDGDAVTATGNITIKGHTEPIRISGTLAEPMADPYGGERFGLKLKAVVDRDAFGVSWNNPLPNGEPALSTKVSIVADLQLVKVT